MIQVDCAECQREITVPSKHTKFCPDCRILRARRSNKDKNKSTLTRSRKPTRKESSDLHNYGTDNKPFSGTIFTPGHILHTPPEKAAKIINDILAGKALYTT